MFLVSSVSLEAGPLCPGQRAVLRCSVPDGNVLTWRYNSVNVFRVFPIAEEIPSSDPIPVDGVEFTVSLLPTSPDLVSEISFEVNSDINGRVMRCTGLNSIITCMREITLQEESSVNVG